jgi:hypothetical protein
MGLLRDSRWSTLSLSSLTPASGALAVPPLTEPGEGGQGWRANQQSAVFFGVPKEIRTIVNLEEFSALWLAVVA